jgi:hypothetical protein
MTMNALISFRKQRDKPPVFTFRRSDGSLTWSKLRNLPIEHDLAHYAVETTLGFTEAFYGLLDQGFATDDFELPREKRPHALLPASLPLEAQQAEHLVGLLQTELICGPNPDFFLHLRQALDSKGLAYPNQLTGVELAAIRLSFSKLLQQWEILPVDEQVELPFSLA